MDCVRGPGGFQVARSAQSAMLGMQKETDPDLISGFLDLRLVVIGFWTASARLTHTSAVRALTRPHLLKPRPKLEGPTSH